MRNIPWKPISISLLILFTLLSCRLLPWGTKKENGYRLSNHQGDFTSFLETAQRQNSPAIIDKDVEISSPVHVHGDITLKGENQPTITANIHSKFNELFHLHEGKHIFSGFDIQQNSNGTGFFTARQAKIIWQNEFDNVNVLSGKAAYQSSRGGLWDEATDSILQWSGTVWRNSTLQVGGIPISIFSQDGPAKYLHLENMKIQNGIEFGNPKIKTRPKGYVSHTLYCHPNVSLRFSNVTLKAGKLALHHFSGGGVPGKNRYVELFKVNALSNGVEMANPQKGYIMIDSCDMGTYKLGGRPTPKVWAKNSNFRNTGNGVQLSGILENCTGQAWSGGNGTTLEIHNCKLNTVSLRTGGKVLVKNSSIRTLTGGDRGNSFHAELSNCEIETINIPNALGKVILKENTTAKKIRTADGVVQQH